MQKLNRLIFSIIDFKKFQNLDVFWRILGAARRKVIYFPTAFSRGTTTTENTAILPLLRQSS